jgi:hypothetical protein
LEFWHHQIVVPLPDEAALPLLEWCRDTDPTPTAQQLRIRIQQPECDIAIVPAMAANALLERCVFEEAERVFLHGERRIGQALLLEQDAEGGEQSDIARSYNVSQATI